MEVTSYVIVVTKIPLQTICIGTKTMHLYVRTMSYLLIMKPFVLIASISYLIRGKLDGKMSLSLPIANNFVNIKNNQKKEQTKYE